MILPRPMRDALLSYGPAMPTRADNNMIGTYKAALRDDPCAYCGATATVLDHIVARRRGGENSWENITAACAVCNGSKHHRSLLAFLGWRRSGLPERIGALEAERKAWIGVGA